MVGHLVAALRADPANLALQVDALQVVRAIATLGSDAHEELTHPQRRCAVVSRGPARRPSVSNFQRQTFVQVSLISSVKRLGGTSFCDLL